MNCAEARLLDFTNLARGLNKVDLKYFWQVIQNYVTTMKIIFGILDTYTQTLPPNKFLKIKMMILQFSLKYVKN